MHFLTHHGESVEIERNSNDVYWEKWSSKSTPRKTLCPESNMCPFFLCLRFDSRLSQSLLALLLFLSQLLLPSFLLFQSSITHRRGCLHVSEYSHTFFTGHLQSRVIWFRVASNLVVPSSSLTRFPVFFQLHVRELRSLHYILID